MIPAATRLLNSIAVKLLVTMGHSFEVDGISRLRSSDYLQLIIRTQVQINVHNNLFVHTQFRAITIALHRVVLLARRQHWPYRQSSGRAGQCVPRLFLHKVIDEAQIAFR